VQVVAAVGELDLNSVPRLRTLIEEAAAASEDGQFYVVDLSRVEFMDSETLKVLIEAHNGVQDLGGDLRLVVRGGLPARILGLTELDEVFRVYPDLQSAME
jgi:anti-sigma B factor antagonist